MNTVCGGLNIDDKASNISYITPSVLHYHTVPTTHNIDINTDEINGVIDLCQTAKYRNIPVAFDGGSIIYSINILKPWEDINLCNNYISVKEWYHFRYFGGI